MPHIDDIAVSKRLQLMADDDYHVFYRYKDSVQNIVGRQALMTSADILEEL